MEALPWVADGLSGRENIVKPRLDEMAVASPRIFRELIGKPWFQSDSVVISVDSWTIDFWALFYHLLPMIYHDEATTFRIVGMPFLEAIDHRDIDTLETLHNLLESDPDGLQRLLSLPALQAGITDDHSGTLSILHLESVDPAAAAAVRALPWAQDDPGNVELLRMLALESKRAFWAYMEQFGDDRINGVVLRRIITIAGIDESTAIQILRMPFLETYEHADLVTVSFLADLSLSNLSELKQILSHPELSDGITNDRMATAVLLCLGIQDPDMADAIDALPWVRDGISAPEIEVRYVQVIYIDSDKFERSTFWNFVEYSQRYSRLVLEMTRKQWIQDGISQSEFSALDKLFTISGKDEAAAVQVLGMPFLETVSPRDTRILETLAVQARAHESNVQQVLHNPVFRGGIRDAQEGVVALLSLELQDPDAAASIHDLSWVRDGIAAAEQDDVLALQISALESKQIFSAIMRKAWVHDGLTQDELSVILFLIALVSHVDGDESAAVQILEMPFLEVVDGVDAAAVNALRFLSAEGYLRQVLSHSTLREGITNDLAIVVGMLDLVVLEKRPDFLDIILNQSEIISVEQRTISLPHSGDVDLAVVHASPRQPNSMDLLEHAVRSHEKFMATPLPKTYVGLLVLPFGGGGGSPTAVLFIGDGHTEPGRVIAHEAAHIYWFFAPTWIAEGAASFMEGISENARTGIQGELYLDTSCELADNLSDLERIELQLYDTVFRSGCNYSMGSKLFADLYDSLGREMFREGFRNLYLRMLEESYSGDTECTGTERGVCSVKAAFVSDADPDAGAIAEPIINRWYYGSEDGPP